MDSDGLGFDDLFHTYNGAQKYLKVFIGRADISVYALV